MYRRSADIEQINRSLADSFPALVSRIVLGPSRQGREISAIRIRGGAGPGRGVLLVGGVHARELLNPDLLVEAVIDLIDHYLGETDWVMGGQRWPAATIRSIVETLELFVLPNANPDGREHVFDVARLWRKNRARLTGTACVGVDVNRNFDLLWGVQTRAPDGSLRTSRSACSDVFVGPGAFSEPETRNVKTLLDAHPIECFVDVHSYSELILFPWGHAPNQTTDPSQRFTLVDTSRWRELPSDAPRYREFLPPSDLERFREIGEGAVRAIQNVRGRRYTAQQGLGLYPTTGTSSDYAYGRHVADPSLRKVYGFTFETGPFTGNVEDSFQPDPPEDDRIKEEATSGIISVLQSFT
jgi:murein tripeptide amidase MpaA